MKTLYLSIPLLLIMFAGFFLGERNSDHYQFALDTIKLEKPFTESPVLSAGESLKAMKIEPGFSIQIVAEEPLVNSPVSVLFDKKGRIWVVEMENYMPDTVGTGEDQPTGKVVILSDRNGDGRMDHRQVFLDSLVLPRAICLIENGLLLAESPKLWYYEIQNDKPVKRTLVDPEYAEGGNVEHQPNGLFRAIDNWIYNAKSSKRYRKVGDKWLIERTHFRGQWGISQDDQGRLFYNNNSENLQGDFFSPGLGASNDNQQRLRGFSENIIKNNRVYPIRPTPGVNRGYMKDILDDSLRLVNFTAACGPVIFNSMLFGKEYYGNAFVAEPSANLIKRNIISEKGYQVAGRQAYTEREFLASTDERFRPVNLNVGPDGALYIVDMYRGIIQHKTYLTPYLKNQIKARNLTEPLSFGRIYKIVPAGKKVRSQTLPSARAQLLPLLNHSNGWVRNQVQQILVDSKNKSLESALRTMLHNRVKTQSAIHALWTMEGLGVLRKTDVLPLLNEKNWTLRAQALSVSPSVINKENYREFLGKFNRMLSSNDTLSAPYLAFLAGKIHTFNPAAARSLLISVSKKYPDNIFIADAVISNLKNQEAGFYDELKADTSHAISRQLKKVMDDLKKKSAGSPDLSKEYPKGLALYRSVCQTCHGPEGNGITGLAPPLNGSDWVKGDKSRLAKVVLYGLSGPITVSSKLYKAPEISGEMPGIAANSNFSDEEITQVLNYIRNAWTNKADKITKEELAGIRLKYKGRQQAFTEEELK
jgi:mono/diheme cytochrome c family protein